VVSILEAPQLRLDHSNLRSLCKRCHDARTARDQGFGRRRKGGGGSKV
jgi:5-methylcytosine-specific restriction protein A